MNSIITLVLPVLNPNTVITISHLMKVAGSPPPQSTAQAPETYEKRSDERQRHTYAGASQRAPHLRHTPFGFLRQPESPSTRAPPHVRFDTSANTRGSDTRWKGEYGTQGLMPCRRRFADGTKVAIEYDGSISVLSSPVAGFGVEDADLVHSYALSISADGQEILEYIGEELCHRTSTQEMPYECSRLQDLYRRVAAWLLRHRRRQEIARFSLPLRAFDLGLKSSHVEMDAGAVDCVVRGNGPEPDYDITMHGRAEFSSAPERFVYFEATLQIRRTRCRAVLRTHSALYSLSTDGSAKELRRQKSRAILPFHLDQDKARAERKFASEIHQKSLSLSTTSVADWLEPATIDIAKGVAARADALFTALFPVDLADKRDTAK